MKYIFVEGPDDNDLLTRVLVGKEDVKIIEYSNKKKEKINGMIRTFKSMNCEYVLLADLDEKDKAERKTEIFKKYRDIDIERIYFVIQEIEAWYLAGISTNNERKYKVNNRLLLDTQNITKEKFEQIFKKSRETVSIIKLTILSEFDVEKSRSRNNSLKVFLDMLDDCFNE